MALYEIKKVPDDVLRKTCTPLEKITLREKDIFEKMFFTMKYFDGIGLAAPQVGILQNLIVVDIGRETFKLANPIIKESNGIDKMIEGCLSVPDHVVEIERAYKILVKGINDEGKNIEIEAEGILARVFQHEIDHLKGKLIIDY